PAAGQGIVAIECRADDGRTRQYLEPINDGEAWSELTCERALLAALGGSCRTPIAALARHPGEGRLALDALLVKPDGSDARRTRRIGAPEDAALMGADAGLALREAAGPAFFETEA
ncbi:MAG TPA: hydroxymethylbilane synthase, partial [Alphaproteobacteria bacterium]|nr:hydroxymethylbilane synthase [Alphaproteobacteria bacterium]